MAMFKVLRGDSSQLSSVSFHDGYAYFCSDTGEFYIDVDLNPSGSTDSALQKRVQINANIANKLSLKDSEGNYTHEYIDIDDLAQIDDITTAIESAASTAQSFTIATTDWITVTTAENGITGGMKATKTWSGTLKCGSAGNIPPIVRWTDNQEEYSKITKVAANPGESGTIIFYIPEIPTAAIEVTVIDIM